MRGGAWRGDRGRCGVYDGWMSESIGLIAGSGRLPVITARGMRDAGRRVVTVGFSGQYDAELPGLSDVFVDVGVLRVGEWARKLRRRGVSQAVMVGGVTKHQLMFMPMWKRVAVMRPDVATMKLWYRVLRHDKRSQTVLRATADELGRRGIELMDSTRFIPEHLSREGVMTQKTPSTEQRADVAFGWPILMRMNDLEIGQSIAVRERDVVAVEAIEGTDAMIRRAGELCHGGGWTLLKGAGPKKDLRYDVPTIGLQTIESLKAAGATCLALDAERVILIDKEQVLDAADAAGIVVMGVG